MTLRNVEAFNQLAAIYIPFILYRTELFEIDYYFGKFLTSVSAKAKIDDFVKKFPEKKYVDYKICRLITDKKDQLKPNYNIHGLDKEEKNQLKIIFFTHSPGYNLFNNQDYITLFENNGDIDVIFELKGTEYLMLNN